MQVPLERSSRAPLPDLLRRAAPLAAGAGLASAAMVVAAHDPAEGGGLPCPFQAATGWWCPGCGLTRSTHHLLNGEVGAAFAANLFTPVALVALAAAWWGWTRRAWGRPLRRTLTVPRAALPWTLAVLGAYGVLRNLPWEPFVALAP